MAAPVLLRSIDPGAFALTNDIGNLVAFLDAVLLPIGWTKPFSATNKAVYRAAVGGPRHYMRVDHTVAQPTIRGYETMSSVDVGTGGYGAGPTAVPNYSTTANSTPRPYFFIADERTMYMSQSMTVATPAGYPGPSAVGFFAFWGFGEFIDFSGVPSNNSLTYFSTSSAHPSTGTAAQGSRGYVGTAPAPFVAQGHSTLTPIAFTRPLPTVPDPTTGAIYVHPCLLRDNNAVRGRLRGIWQPLHVDLEQDDTFSGVGVHIGRTFVNVRGQHSAGGAGSYARFSAVHETSPWDIA